VVDGDRGRGESEAEIPPSTKGVREGVDDRQEDGHTKWVSLVHTYPQRSSAHSSEEIVADSPVYIDFMSLQNSGGA